MKWYSLALTVLVTGSSFSETHAQKNADIKFGKPRPEDFAITGVSFDSGANAVVIADIGSTSFEGNTHGGFNMVYTRFMRVKILTRDGFGIADNSMLVYHFGSSEERIKELKGVTYNNENGEIVQTKLEANAVFTEKYSKNIQLKKFTIPGLKVGSVFDISYTITSPFYEHIRKWSFQGQYPRLWSEYTVTIPPAFHYVTQSVGSPVFAVSESKDVFERFSIVESGGTERDETYNISGNSVQHRWAMKDLPGIHDESYLATTDNYAPAVRFQLHYFQWTAESPRHDRMGDWFMASKKMMEDEDFGKALTVDNRWMTAALKDILGTGLSDEQKMRKIYAFIRSNFTCTSHSGVYASGTLRDVYMKRSGTVVDINLLLTAMLRHEGINADPVVLSTRENGVAEQSYPMIEQFNYVICNATIGSKSYHLDASDPLMGFNKLTTDCYNGQGRIINADKPYLVNLYPDSVTEARLTNVIIIADDKSFLTGSCMQQLGDAGSHQLREKIKQSSVNDYFKTVSGRMSDEAEMTGSSIDSLDQYDFPVTVHYDFRLKHDGDPDLIYFNPIIAEKYSSNPFAALNRKFPVEMPYCVDEIYTLNLDIPKGYTADEIPKSAKILLNETEGYFEYLIQKSGNIIQMRVRLKLKKADFETEDYSTLRDFYSYIVKKESEQIVFKKIK